MDNLNYYISSNPQVLGGTPTISGTRIPVSHVIELISQGYSIDLLNHDYPQVGEVKMKGLVSTLLKGSFDAYQKNNQTIGNSR
jgi:uncharacterized protein (DUF433 family)